MSPGKKIKKNNVSSEVMDENRLTKLLEGALKVTIGDYEHKIPITEKGDEIDALAVALNTLSEELLASGKHITDFEKRINDILEKELKYTMMDFSQRMAITEKGDELDAIAVGMNTMAEELESYINQLKTREEEIQQLNVDLNHNFDKLEAMNKELESFSYSVSHDLRAPLRAIHGYSQMLIEDYKNKFDEEGMRILNTVMYNAIKMGKLIDDLLEFSRLGKRELKTGKIDMNEIAEGVLRDLQQTTKHHSEIIIDYMPHTNADYGLIFLVYQNLISNAIKYSSKKENPKIEIGMIDTQNGKTFFVKDNGVGFNMKYYDKLFGVFQRLHSQEEFAGTGVGLAIVKRIILRHKGLIWAESEPEKGSVFYFTLGT